MTFKQAVKATPYLGDKFQKGLKALRAKDRKHISIEDPTNLIGSVDVDSALTTVYPNENRWDFAIACRHTNRGAAVVYWTELHTASTSEVDVVIRKARWLLAWLAGDGRTLSSFERDIVWVSSGATSMLLTGPQKKQMALAGLRHVGSRLLIRNRR